jgi:uncharacterized BrkB/YihY/UPF0761 family membrane protein
MKKKENLDLLGFLVLALVFMVGTIKLSSSGPIAQWNAMKTSGMVEKTEKISSGMPLWHAIPRFLFRRY